MELYDQARIVNVIMSQFLTEVLSRKDIPINAIEIMSITFLEASKSIRFAVTKYKIEKRAVTRQKLSVKRACESFAKSLYLYLKRKKLYAICILHLPTMPHLYTIIVNN